MITIFISIDNLFWSPDGDPRLFQLLSGIDWRPEWPAPGLEFPIGLSLVFY